MSYRGAWTATASYAVNDAASFDGTTYIAQSTNTENEPDLYPLAWTVLAQAGSVGPTGASGLSPTVAIGTVTTGAAGTAAVVTNNGSAASAVFNFTLPQGAAGSPSTGGALPSVYHSVSFSDLYFSTSNSNSSAGESNTIVTWVPAGCTATALNVYSLQPNPITVTLRAGTVTSLANTALACTAASLSSCTASGSVVLAAGAFIDLEITGANGTPSSVWTSLTCN